MGVPQIRRVYGREWELLKKRHYVLLKYLMWTPVSSRLLLCQTFTTRKVPVEGPGEIDEKGATEVLQECLQ